jgi:hypothetical protein
VRAASHHRKGRRAARGPGVSATPGPVNEELGDAVDPATAATQVSPVSPVDMNDRASRWLLPAIAALSVLNIVISVRGIADLYYRFPIWEMLSWLHHYFTEPLLRFLLLPDNGHVFAAPKVLYALDYELFRARGVFLIGCSLVSIVGSAAAFSAGARLGGGWGDAARWCSVVAVTAGLSWLAAWENLLNPFNLLIFLCFFFTLSSLACLAGPAIAQAEAGERIPWRRIAGSLVLLILALFSYGYGLVAAIAFCILAIMRRPPRRELATILAVAMLGLLVYSYAIGFHLPEYNTDPTRAVFRPLAVAGYVIRLLGAAPRALVPGILPDAVATVVGDSLAVGALLYAAWEVVSAIRRADAVRGRGGFLIATALFAVGAAVTTALSRMDFGLGHALSSRYMTNAVVFWMAVAGLAWRRSRAGGPRTRLALLVAVALVPALLTVSNVRQLAAVAEYRQPFEEFRWMLISRAYAPVMFPAVHPHPAWARRIFQELDQRGWSVFDDREAMWLWRPLQEVAIGQSTECVGYFDIRRPLGEDASFTHAGGWSYDVGLHQAVRYVVVTDSSDIIRAVGRSAIDRPDVMKARPDVRTLRTGWVAYVAAPVPLEGYRAYAFLERGGSYTSCRLP